MGRNPIETVMGAVVLLVAAVFLVFAWTSANLRPVEGGYPLTAVFFKVGGLDDGSDVKVNGIKVGTVTEQNLDTDTFEAVVSMTINPGITLPEDTRASIVSDGLLGGKYVRLEPGQAMDPLGPGDVITRTQDFQSMEELVGEVIFLATQPSGEGQ